MDLSNGISSVVPSVHGVVLGALGRTSRPLSGRAIAELVGDKASQKGVYLVLRSLVGAGIVTAQEHPPAILYQLNREHLAADSIVALASLRERLIDAIREHVASWPMAPYGAWIFGSFARGTAGSKSDVDVFVVRPSDTTIDDEQWRAQLRDIAQKVRAWSGNDCRVAEFAQEEFMQLFSKNDRLAQDLRTDAIALTSRRLPVRKPVRSGA